VQENPDLGEELQMLQQTVVSHDQIVFEDKHSLLKNEQITALQEKLLLFMDGELPGIEQERVAALLASDRTAETEWSILQKTKLQPDQSIVFVDKGSLYRREGARVVGFKWWRVAAAAILLGFGIWTGVAVYQHNTKTTTGTQGIARGDNKTKPGQSLPNEVIQPAVNPPAKENVVPETATTSPVQKKSIPPTIEKNDRSAEKIVKQNNAVQKDNMVLNKEEENKKKPNNNLPKPIIPVLENINKDERNKTVMTTVQPKTREEDNNKIVKNDVQVNKIERSNEPGKITKDINTSGVVNAFATKAVYNETDEIKNDDKILYMDEDKVKRSKIGGFFRKLKRVVERNTNIKTGDGIKVAGFEIAIK